MWDGKPPSPGAGLLCPVLLSVTHCLGTWSAGACSWGGRCVENATPLSYCSFCNKNTTGKIPIYLLKVVEGREEGGEEARESAFPYEHISMATIPLISVLVLHMDLELMHKPELWRQTGACYLHATCMQITWLGKGRKERGCYYLETCRVCI